MEHKDLKDEFARIIPHWIQRIRTAGEMWYKSDIENPNGIKTVKVQHSRSYSTNNKI